MGQIHDLIQTIDTLSDEELLERIRATRHRRETLRPVAAKKVERAEKKSSRAKVNKAAAIVEDMTEEQRAQLILLLTQGDQG